MKTNTSHPRAIVLSLMMVSTMAALVIFVRTSPPRNVPRTSAQVREAYGKLSLSFEANRGQADEAVNFLARGPGYTLALSPTEAVFVLARGFDEPSPGCRDGSGVQRRDADSPSPEPPPPLVLRMNLVGANRSAAVEGENELEGRVNYFTGNDPARWQTDIPTFGRVRYHEVYPGIDVVYYGNQRRLEYDFVIAPGQDARTIALEFAGAESVEVETGTGALLLGVGDKTIRQHKPVVYQEMEGGRREVEGRYALRSGGRVGFEVGEYDPGTALIIDPVLEYSTYLGGTASSGVSGVDQGHGIAVDSAGNAYVTGQTGSLNFPTVNAFQSTKGGGSLHDAFVTKLNAAGSALVYSTYLGGNNGDQGEGIAVDSAGNAYVAGTTRSTDFPTANAFQGTNAGDFEVFVTKLSPAGSALVYSTYLGGGLGDFGSGIAVDSAGNAYVTGRTRSTGFPTANAFQSIFGGGSEDAFVTKLNAAGSALVYSTYLGGSATEGSVGIAVDLGGNAYVAGATSSTNFPTANSLQSMSGGFLDAFVTKLNTAGSALVYSTYLGGNDGDEATSIAVDSAGNAYVTGSTRSINFPTANALQSTYGGDGLIPGDAFVAKLNAAGSAFVYSTYLGGNDGDQAGGIAVDSAGNAYVTGLTFSSNFPIANAFQGMGSDFDGIIWDAFITKLNPSGSALIYSTYLGGKGADQGDGIAADSTGNAYVTGFTSSVCFPTTTGAFDTTPSGGTDAFITKISETAPASPLTPCPSQLLNIATRMRVLSGDSALIGGFIITGSASKYVIIRGIGPSLSGVGIQGALANPTLELFDANQTSLAVNDDWKSNEAEVAATTIPPSHDSESAIVQTLAPGNYTAVLRGQNNATGIGVVEVYDLATAASSKLANISSRGFVDSGDNAMIGGFIVGGGNAGARVLVRGIGPSLASFFPNFLENPTLELRNADGSLIRDNDNWRDSQEAEIQDTTIPPTNDLESAIVVSVGNGNYTAVLRGASNTTGVAVVEVYNLP